jgi:YD repeat-containing protein
MGTTGIAAEAAPESQPTHDAAGNPVGATVVTAGQQLNYDAAGNPIANVAAA